MSTTNVTKTNTPSLRLPASSIKTLTASLLVCLSLSACGGSDKEVAKETPQATPPATQPVNNEANQAQQAQIDAQKAQIEAQKAQIEAQKAQLQAEQQANKQSQKPAPAQPEKPSKPKPKVSDAPKLSMKAEKSMAIIKKFFHKNGKLYVTVDFVQYVEPSDTHEGGIKNVNPKLRTYEVSKSSYPNCMSGSSQTVDALITEWEDLRADEPIYDIGAKKGKITEIRLSCAG